MGSEPVRRVTWLSAYPPAERREWADSGHPGLGVRIGPREVAFYYDSHPMTRAGRPKWRRPHAPPDASSHARSAAPRGCSSTTTRPGDESGDVAAASESSTPPERGEAGQTALWRRGGPLRHSEARVRPREERQYFRGVSLQDPPRRRPLTGSQRLVEFRHPSLELAPMLGCRRVFGGVSFKAVQSVGELFPERAVGGKPPKKSQWCLDV